MQIMSSKSISRNADNRERKRVDTIKPMAYEPSDEAEDDLVSNGGRMRI